MDSFFSFLKFVTGCVAFFWIAFAMLLALPQCRLRSIGLQIIKWLFAAGLMLLVASPIDVLPDVIPVLGWGDDLAYVVGAICAARSAMNEGRTRSRVASVEELPG